MTAGILQLNPQIKVRTPLGMGWAFFLIDYGQDTNPVFVTRLDDGHVKNFTSNDIEIEGNPMLGTDFLKNKLTDLEMFNKQMRDKAIEQK